MKPYHIICILISFLVAVNVSSCHAKYGKEEIEQEKHHTIIGKYYPGFRVINFDDRGVLTQEFIKKKNKGSNPSFLCDDFDGNGMVDYAFLLTSSSRETDKYIFVILLQLSTHNLTPYLSLDLANQGPDVIISKVEIGTEIKQTEGINSDHKNVFLMNPSIEIVYVGKAAIVYYWDRNRQSFASITTAD